MPRTKSATRKVRLSVYIDEDVYARALIDLFSDVQGRVPLGVWSRTVTELLRQALEQRPASLDPIHPSLKATNGTLP